MTPNYDNNKSSLRLQHMPVGLAPDNASVSRTQVKLEQLECLRSEIPPDAPWLPILEIHISSHVKTRQSQSNKFWKIAKNSILHKTLHQTHLLKWLDNMYKYEMDPTRTVGATERTRDAGWTDGRTDGRTDGVKPIYTPTSSLFGGINTEMSVICKWIIESLCPYLTSCNADFQQHAQICPNISCVHKWNVSE